MYEPIRLKQRNPGIRVAVALATALCSLTGLAVPGSVSAQGVAIGQDQIHVRSFGSQGGVVIDKNGFITAGASGTNGTVLLYDFSNDVTAAVYGSVGDIFLGGGNQDGDIFLLGSDGITPNIQAQGRRWLDRAWESRRGW